MELYYGTAVSRQPELPILSSASDENTPPRVDLWRYNFYPPVVTSGPLYIPVG